MKGTTRVILISLLCLFVGTCGFLVLSQRFNKTSGAVEQRRLAMEMMGQYLAQHFPGQKVLIVSNPFTQEQGRPKEIYAFEKAAIRGLREGLGNALTIQAIAFPKLRAEVMRDPTSVYVDPKTTTPLSYLTEEGAWDQLLQKHSDTDILVSLIGLPANLPQVQAWRQPGKPSFALLLPDLHFVGSTPDVRSAFQTGKIAVAILNKPDASPESDHPESNTRAEFEKRFILLTGQTFDQLTNSYPALLTDPLRLD